MHTGDPGFALSLLAGDIPLPKEKLPIDIGSIQDQQISVIGLTKRPLQVTLALADTGIDIAINSTIKYC